MTSTVTQAQPLPAAVAVAVAAAETTAGSSLVVTAQTAATKELNLNNFGFLYDFTVVV